MPTFAKGILSGSVNGKPLRILGATTSGGTLIHTAVTATGSNQADEIWIWATNTEATSGQITLRMGGLATSDEIKFSVPSQSGLYLIAPGLILNGALEVRAHASASNTLSVVGYVNSVTT